MGEGGPSCLLLSFDSGGKCGSGCEGMKPPFIPINSLRVIAVGGYIYILGFGVGGWDLIWLG